MEKVLKLTKFVNPVREGMVPVNWLKSALKKRKFVNPVSDGIGPVSKLPPPVVLPLTSIDCNAVIPVSEGIVPVNLLLNTLKLCNAVSPEIAGNVPTRLFPPKLIATTLLCVASHITPNQVHSVPAAPFQLVLLVHAAPLVKVKRSVNTVLCVAVTDWHACQFTPVAVSQAASVAGTPLEVNWLAHRALCPAVNVAGGVGTGPVNWLLSTRRDVRAASPVSEGIGPVNWLF